MDIGRTLSRAWEITWRWKVLWLLGFLAALGEGNRAGTSGYQFSAGDLQNGTFPRIDLPAIAPALIVTFACMAIIVGILLFVISVMARGSLIAGVAQIEKEGNTTLGQAWVEGQRRFWTLFGIGILTFLPVLVVVAAMIVGIVAIAGGAFFSGFQGGPVGPDRILPSAVGPFIGALFACICPSVCLLFLLIIVLSQIRMYAERAAILDNLGWTEAFGRGWQVLRQNLGATIVLWIAFLVLGLIISAIALAILLPIVAPIAVIFGRQQLSSAAIVPICGLGLIGTIVGAIISAVLNTFTSATWTLAYRAMTNAGLPPPSVTKTTS